MSDHLENEERPEAVSFLDGEAARAHAEKRRAWMAAQRRMIEAEKSLSVEEVADKLNPVRGSSQ